MLKLLIKGISTRSVRYFQKKEEKIILNKLMPQVNSIDEETFNLIKPEVDTFLNTYMNESKCF